MKSGFLHSPRFRLAVTVLYAGLLLLGTHLPPDNAAVAQVARLPMHELTHFAAYLVLALLVFAWSGVGASNRRDLSPLPPSPIRRGEDGRERYGLPVLAALGCLAALDELTQPLCGRIASWSDWLADLAGLSLGWAIGWLTGALRPRERAPS